MNGFYKRSKDKHDQIMKKMLKEAKKVLGLAEGQLKLDPENEMLQEKVKVFKKSVESLKEYE